MPRKPAKPKDAKPTVKENLTVAPPAPPVVPADERERLRVENRFLEIQRSHGNVTESRLRDLYFIHSNPINADGKIQRLRGDEITELREFVIIGGKISEKPGDMKIPAEISMHKFAEFVTAKYGGGKTEWFKQQVDRWIKDKGMPPVGKLNRLGSGPVWEKWFVDNILEKTGVNASGDDTFITKGAKAEAERKITAARRELRADMEEERKFDARWMLTEAHDYWSGGLATVTRQSMLSEHKKFLDEAKLTAKETGLDDGQIEKLIGGLRPKLEARFAAWQLELEKKAEALDKAAWELSEQKKSELKLKKA